MQILHPFVRIIFGRTHMFEKITDIGRKSKYCRTFVMLFGRKWYF